MFKAIRAGLKAGAAQGDFIRERYDSALSNITQAIALDPEGESKSAYLAVKGKCLYHLDRKPEAKPLLQKAEELTMPLLEVDKEGIALKELNKIQWYIEQCG